VSGGLALLRAFCQRKIVQVSRLLFLLFCSFIVTTGVARGARGPWRPPNFSHILSFVLWQGVFRTKYFWSLKVIVFGSPKCLSGYAIAYNHCHTDNLYHSRAQPCSSVSSLSHGTFLIGVQSSSDQKISTTQDCQTLQNSDEKQYCHSYIA